MVFFLNGRTYNPTPDTTGAWSVQVAESDRLVDANYSSQVLVTDAAGNQVLSEGGRFVVDTTSPITPRGALDTRSDTGTVGDNRTSDRVSALSGTAEPGSTVEITLVGPSRTVVISTTANGSGVWTATVPANEALPNGLYTIALRSTDGAGNASSGPGTPFEVYAVQLATPVVSQLEDDVAVTGRVEADGVTDDATPTLRITGPSGCLVEVFDDGTLLGTAVETSVGFYTFTPATALAEGRHQLTVRASDNVGNASEASLPFRFTLDVTPPALPTFIQNTGTTISGQANLLQAETLTLRLGAASFSVVPDRGEWTLDLLRTPPTSGTLNVVDGPFVVRAEAQDQAGNLSVTLQGTARGDSISLLADDIRRLVNGTQLVFGGSGTDTLSVANSSVELDLTAIADTAITSIERISLGRNSLRLTASDILGLGGNELVIDGLAGGAVRLQGTGWSATGEVTEGGSTYTVYEAAGVRVKVQATLAVTPNASPQGGPADAGGARGLAWANPDPVHPGEGSIDPGTPDGSPAGSAGGSAPPWAAPRHDSTVLRLGDLLAPMRAEPPGPLPLPGWPPTPQEPATLGWADLLDGTSALVPCDPPGRGALHPQTLPLHSAASFPQPLALHHDLL